MNPKPQPWRIRPRSVAAGAVLGLAATLPAAPAAAAPDDALPVLTYARYEDAFNRGQIDTALEQFTDDTVVIAGPGCTAKAPCIGKEAVREGLFNRFVPNRLGIRIRQVSWDGVELRSRVELTSEPMARAGVARIVGSDSIQFRDGKIMSLVWQPDLHDGQTFRWLNPPERKP
jgi:SnoaL-like domain